MVSGREDEILRLMGVLGREPPPDLQVDAILRRWRHQRRRNLVVGGIGIAAGLLGLVLLLAPRPAEPPVHLDLRVVDASPEEALGGALAPFETTPAELNRP